jgi:hypothetical protein
MLRRCGAAAIASAKCCRTGSPFRLGGTETRIAFASIMAAVISGFASLPSNTKAATACLSAPDAMDAAFLARAHRAGDAPRSARHIR